MKSLTAIKAEVNRSLDHARMKAEAVRLQLTLGKAEFNDNLIVKQEEATQAAQHLSQYLSEIGASVGKMEADIATQADNIKLKVALGKMEGTESLEEVKAELTRATSQFENSFEGIERVEAEKVSQVKAKLSDYMAKVSSLKASVEAKLESTIK